MNSKFCILGILMLFSCSDSFDKDDREKYEYYKFSKQITPSGKYVIYDYARYGAMALMKKNLNETIIAVDINFILKSRTSEK